MFADLTSTELQNELQLARERKYKNMKKSGKEYELFSK